MGNQLGAKRVIDPKFLPDAPGKKHVCVIGGGSSGLVIMKELLRLGHSVTCFELLPRAGGVYVKSYQKTILTTSSLMTAWSDFSDGKENDPKFWTAEEYLEYIDGYAKKYDLLKHIHFSHKVEVVRKCSATGKWLVTVRGGRGCDNIERCENTPEDPKAEPRTLAFDAIAVATGTNNFAAPIAGLFPGQERFKGELIHSEDYRNPDRFTGKRVLIIGAGESGSDICNEISKVASKVAVAIRGLHGHIIPRIQSHGRVTDLNTNRCRYSNPYVFGDYIGYVNQMAKRFFTAFYPQSDLTRVLRKIAELNMRQKTSAFSKFGCKNEGFVTAMVLRDAELHRDTFEIFEDKVVFADGSEFQCDAIVACVGYRNIFPFFDQYHPELCHAGMNPRTNYKQIFAVEVEKPGEVAFFGFARPAFGSVPPTVEMQSRFFALVTNGEIQLPPKEEMRTVAEADMADWTMRFKNDAIRVKGLVDYQIYCDGLAKIIGCMPPLVELFFKKPMIWFKVMFGPFTVHQYRLVGPYADLARAEEVYKKTPVGDLLETSITLSFLLTAKFLSLLGFKRFTPNNF
jgi:dimethylaniline monooxygenase (N-oxide forming)